MSLLDVQHQPVAQRLVQRALGSGRLPHAYVFCGPSGVGKELFALRLAQLLLCPAPITIEGQAPGADDARTPAFQDGCGRCDDCRWSEAGTHPDLHLIYRQLARHHDDPRVRARKALDIGVDVVRRFVIDAVAAKPLRGRAKIFIIREADRITPAAQNAMLKTLEEPPATTYLILLVRALDRLLPTTRSRCQLVNFSPLPTDFVADRLAALRPDLDAEAVRLLSVIAQGSLGAAREAAEADLHNCNERLVELLANLDPGRLSKHLADESKTLTAVLREQDREMSDTEAQRHGLQALLSLAAAWYRDLLHVGCGGKDCLANTRHLRRLTSVLRRLSAGDCAEAIRLVAATEGQLNRNVNVQLCLDALAIKLSRLGRRA